MSTTNAPAVAPRRRSDALWTRGIFPHRRCSTSQPRETPWEHGPDAIEPCMGATTCAQWIRSAISGLFAVVDAIPRALPWAGVGRAAGAPNPRPNGAPQGSLGQRPRTTATHSSPALKGRPNA